MAKGKARAVRIERQAADFSGHVIGRIVAISDEEQAKVDFPGNPNGPVTARSTLVRAVKSGFTRRNDQAPPRNPRSRATTMPIV